MNIKREEENIERKKLQVTQNYIDKEIKESEERLERGFEDYDFDDYADDFMKAALKDKFTQRIKNLKMVINKPYFARVDFIEKGDIKRDAFYLGKVMVTDHNTLEQIVIDWRAPIADLYYEGRLGEANYNCPAGNIDKSTSHKACYSWQARMQRNPGFRFAHFCSIADQIEKDEVRPCLNLTCEWFLQGLSNRDRFRAPACRSRLPARGGR